MLKPRKVPVILAGRLTPDNVAEAVSTVVPYGIDVNSGVDDTFGNKSAKLSAALVSRARDAGVSLLRKGLEKD